MLIRFVPLSYPLEEVEAEKLGVCLRIYFIRGAAEFRAEPSDFISDAFLT